ncbi:MAG TPA: hypothetical protein VHH36_05260 [Candidatus Thermoplasmatota archaeon]|nr:hypothetical protein [Candidatus Thermoplasmatota archaeon]
MAVIGPEEVVTLSWVPPAVVVPDGYKVYGKNESETSWTMIQTIPHGTRTYTTIADDYDRYGVATIVDNDESIVVIASNMQLPCISVYPFDLPPGIEIGCWGGPLD